MSHSAAKLAQLAIGEASPGQPMTDDAIALWMSSGKPITAAAILQLVEQGEIDLEDSVAHYLPLFAAHGKSYITVRHLLTHTAGIRTARFKFPQDDWDAIIAAICDAQPEWEAGEEGGYHTQTTWFLSAKLFTSSTAERSTSTSARDLHATGHECLARYARQCLPRLRTGRPLLDMPNTATGEPKPAPMTSFDWSTRPRPGGNCMGPISQLVTFYEMLLNGGERNGTGSSKRHRRTHDHPPAADMLDHTFKQTVDWESGIDQLCPPRGGRCMAPHSLWLRPTCFRSFGHGGAQSSIALPTPSTNSPSGSLQRHAG